MMVVWVCPQSPPWWSTDAAEQVVYSHGKMTVRQRLQGLYDVAASSFADVEVALGLAEEEDEDSDIDF